MSCERVQNPGVLSFEYREGGLWFSNVGLWLDAPRSQGVGVPVFVSHAHSDHTARHREVIATRATSAFMEARLGQPRRGSRRTHVLEWYEERRFVTQGIDWSITLLPAGHIWGSAMALIRAGGESVLYTGDFKLTPSLTAEPCEVWRARFLIMETTFGRPRYAFPDRELVAREMVAFCEQTLRENRVPVLQGYALGKAQELVAIVLQAGLPVSLHPRVAEMTDVYRRTGGCLPEGEIRKAPAAEPSVLVCPPGVAWEAWLPPGAEARVAIATGWAVDAGARYRYGAAAAFPLSDHADFGQLVTLVERVGPERVFTVHGYAAEFAARLRETGWDAWALSEPDQLELPLQGALGSLRYRKNLSRKDLAEEGGGPDDRRQGGGGGEPR